MKRPALLLALLLTTVGSSPGCSWIFVQPLPGRYERGDFSNCTTSVAAPLADTLFTLASAGSSIYVASQDNVTNKGWTVVTLGLLGAGVLLSSAIYGYRRTGECRTAKEEADDRPSRRSPAQKPDAPRFGD
jgi:hypothetical protein